MMFRRSSLRGRTRVADRENIYVGIRPLTTQVLAAFDVGRVSGAISFASVGG